MEWFCEELQNIAKYVNDIINNIVPINLTLVKKKDFLSATICHICNNNFKIDDIKVQDHCHLTGKYNGAPHQLCNLKYQKSRIIPIVFHNLSSYDAHFIIKTIATQIPGVT